MQASTTKLLKETCSYIKSLHREVDDLSDRLSDLMSTMDSNSPGAARPREEVNGDDYDGRGHSPAGHVRAQLAS